MAVWAASARARLPRGLQPWLRRRGLFAIAFAVLAVWTFATILANPIGPGQDYNFHLMSASIAARGWSGDPAVGSLYHRVFPLDCNTLFYVLLFPFEKLLGPVRAFQVGIGLFYIVGYPAACAAALALFRRPLWGALLAFPLCWVRTFASGGYMPFVSSAPWFILALALFHRFIDDDSPRGIRELPPTVARRRLVLAALACSAVFLSHGHMHGWLMIVLAVVTLWVMGQTVLRVGPFSPVGAVQAALLTGLRAFLVVAPSVALTAAWYYRAFVGAQALKSAPMVPSADTMQAKLDYAYRALVLVRHADEYKWIAALFVVSLVSFVLAGRRRERVPTPEIAFLLTTVSYFALPNAVTEQGIGARQLDIAMWLLPLVVYPRAPERARGRELLIVASLLAFAVDRTAFLAKSLRALQPEVAGMLELAESCPKVRGELAYVTFGREPAAWIAESLHQSHETFSAICEIDTPVYDAQVYPHNLQPLRYKGALPAPVTILVDDAQWWKHPRLWEDFEVVLVRSWKPTAEQLADAQQSAVLLRASGTWQLWKRKAGRE